MINVALPGIMRSFGSTLVQTEWVVLIYLLTISVSLLFWGRFGDYYCKSRVYLIGMIVFSLGSLSCFLATNVTWLCCFRWLQAIGAAMMMATGPAIIRNNFKPEVLGRVLGLIGVATSLGLMLGPVISGFIIHRYSWRIIFLVTVPVGLFGSIFGYLSMKPFAMRRISIENVFSFDWLGMILWALTISITVLLSTLHETFFSDVFLFGSSIILLLIVFLVKVELKRKKPFVPVSLFRNRSYSIAIFCAALSFAVLFAVLVLMPFYLTYVLDFTSQTVGLVMMAAPVSVFIVSPLSGLFYNRLGARLLTTTGLAIVGCGLFLLCFVSVTSSVIDVAWRLAVLGCGQALFLSPNTTNVLQNVGPEQTGVSAGMLATARNLGMLAGVSMAGFLFEGIFSKVSGGLDLSQYNSSQATNFLIALRGTFVFAGIFAIIGAVLSALRTGRGNCHYH